MCAAAAADGIEVLAATPHVRDDYPTTPGQMEEALASVRAAAGGTIRLVGGGEVALERLDQPREDLARFGLGGNPRYVLVEMPYSGWPLGLAETLFRLKASGITPVLAHPERNPEVQARPGLLAPVVAGGALVQLTAASVDGRLGERARACAGALLDARLAHLLASDSHAPSVRATGLSAAVRALDDETLGRWLTEDVPRAILEDAQVPSRPPAGRRRRFFRR